MIAYSLLNGLRIIIQNQIKINATCWYLVTSMKMFGRIVYKDENSSFKEVLKKDNSFIIHCRNIQYLAIFKVKEGLSNTIMNDILQTRTLPYNLRSQTDFVRSFVDTSRFGLNSLRYFASKEWNIVASDIKNASHLAILQCK